MARCRRCGTPLSGMHTGQERVCAACGRQVQEDVDRGLSGVIDALLLADCAPTPDAALEQLECAEDHLRHLLPYEEQDLLPIDPKPSGLLSLVARKRRAALEALSAPEARGGAGGIRTPAGRVVRPAGETPPGGDSKDGWIGDGSSAVWFGAVQERAERRHGTRERVRCYVAIEPGGLRGTTKDLSLGGAQVQAPAFHRPGNRVHLVLNTERGSVRTEGVVRWVQKLGVTDHPDGVVGLGVQFGEPPALLKNYLMGRAAVLGG